MKQENLYLSGTLAMIPIMTGVIPFGLVMGAVCADANLSFFNSVTMNVLVFAGASQLAAVDLMTKNAASSVVVLTGLVINLRFLLYSAAISPVVQKSSFWIKLFCAHSLTDQSYAMMSSHQHKLKSNAEAVKFYLGSCFCMLLTWHLSMIVGYIFGNLAPSSWSLDFAVPLSFAALVIPTLKNRTYLVVATFSALISLPLSNVPYRAGLIVTAGLAMSLAWLMTRKRAQA